MAESVVSPVSAAGVVPPPPAGKSKQLLWFGIFIAVVLIGVIFAVAFFTLSSKRQDTEDKLLERQKTIVDSRVKIAAGWLQAMENETKRLVAADIFKLFASEVDKLPGDVPLLFAPETGESSSDDPAGQFRSQLPLMRSMLSEFVAYSQFAGAEIVNSRAQIYISTDPAAKPLDERQTALVQRVIETGVPAYSPIRLGDTGTVLELYMPIMSPDYERQSTRPVAVALFFAQMDAKVVELLNLGAVPDPGASLHLVQRNGDEFEEVVPGAYALRKVSGFSIDDSNTLPFARRTALAGKGDTYSYGAPVRAAGWWLVQESSAELLQARFDEDAKTTYGLAGLFALVLVLLISCVWWFLVGKEQSATAAHIRDCMLVIDDQKRLLDGINNTITDPISLTDAKGAYRYVNKSFAQAVGRPEDEVCGLDSQAVFGFDTAKRLNASDQHVLMTGEHVTVSEVLWLQSKRYFSLPPPPPGARAPPRRAASFRCSATSPNWWKRKNARAAWCSKPSTPWFRPLKKWTPSWAAIRASWAAWPR